MSVPSLSRRRFLALSGVASAQALFGRTLAAEPKPTSELAALVAGDSAFALDLYGQLRKESGNLFLSPFSISTALAMTSAGAKGATLDEMNKALHLPKDPHQAFGKLLQSINGAGAKRNYQLTTANAIWAQKGYPWRAEFKDLTSKSYGAGVIETDFGMPEAARQAINAWVEKETKEKIKDLIPAGAVDPLTRMVLTNAIYFKAAWAEQFKKHNTKDQPFTTADGTKVDVPMMTQTETCGYGEFTLSSGKQGQVLELPYVGRELSMYVFLPREASALGAVEEALTPDSLATWVKGVARSRVQVFLPRFKVEKALGLNAPLQSLGMKAAFSDRTADFSGMQTGQEKLFISAVLHKAFVDVNEEGTEAAAATAVVVGVRSAVPTEPKTFRADHPFLFLIRENKTGSILFLGRVSNPKG